MEDSDSRESEDVENEYVEPGLQEKPTKADYGKVRKSPKGVGNGLSDPTRRRVTLKFKKEAERISKKYKLEMLVGIHTPTKVKKSWHFEAYGERMKEFVNFSATGKKLKTDMKLLSDSWLIDDEINKQEEDEASGDSTLTSQPSISALGEEAVAIVQQRGAEKQKKKQEEKDRKEATRIKRMSQLPHTNRKVQNKVVSRSGSFKVAPSPSKTVPAAPSSMTSTSPFKVSYHRQNTKGAKKQLFHSKNTAVDLDPILNVEELTLEETHLSDVMDDLSAPSPGTLGQQRPSSPPAVAKKSAASPANATPKPLGTSQTSKVKYVARKSKVSKAKEYPAAAAFQTTPEVLDMSAEKPTEKSSPPSCGGENNVLESTSASGRPPHSIRLEQLPIKSTNLTPADDETSVSPSKTAALTPVDTSQIDGDRNVATVDASVQSKVSEAKQYPAAATAFQTTPTEVTDMSAEKPTLFGKSSPSSCGGGNNVFESTSASGPPPPSIRLEQLPVESTNLTRADDETSVSPSKTAAPVDTFQIYVDRNVATDEASGAPKDSYAEKNPAATTAKRANIVEKSPPSIGVDNYGLQKTSVSDATDEFPPTPPPSRQEQLSLIELTTLTPVDAKERVAPSANAGQKPKMGTSKNIRGKNVAPAAVSRRSSKPPAVKPKTSAKPAASISALAAMPAKQRRSLKKRTKEEYDMGFCDISLCSKPNQDWIGCENCDRWFHFRCAKIKKSDYKKEDPYVCPLCKY